MSKISLRKQQKQKARKEKLRKQKALAIETSVDVEIEKPIRVHDRTQKKSIIIGSKIIKRRVKRSIYNDWLKKEELRKQELKKKRKQRIKEEGMAAVSEDVIIKQNDTTRTDNTVLPNA